MGQELNSISIRAFSDELEKIAGPLLSFVKNLGELGGRAGSPIKGLATGWRGMSPAGVLAHGGEEAAALGKAIAKTRSGGAVRRTLGAGTHLEAPATSVLGGGIRQGAEQLSRQGWTGKSALTKYLPIGEKTQMVGLGPALSIPALMDKDTAPGEELGKTLGFTGGGVLAAGTGLPGIMATLAAGHFGGKLGKRVDRAIGTAPQGEE